MKPTVAVIAAGGMGAAVGARLSEKGAEVRTSLSGRSKASAERARAAGMAAASDADIAACDFVLSIVPPKQAVALAERLAPALRASPRKPIYVDCNAVSPETTRRVGAIVAGAGCFYIDGGIIGGPPRPDYAGPAIYVSGPENRRAEMLTRYGLAIRCMDGAVGDASALKMCYGGITKGLIALGSTMMLAANRAGIADALQRELAASQPALLASFGRSVPDMFPKAYRWVAEMEEIASFLGKERAESRMYDAVAAFYERMAADFDGPKSEIGALARSFGAGK